MNIPNTISHDSTYSKRDLSDIQIKQSVPEVIGKSKFNNTLGNVDKKDKIEELSHTINQSKEHLQTFDRKLEISIHEKTREVMVKVIDTNTDEVIRELPPEKVLDNVANLREKIGFLLDKKI